VKENGVRMQNKLQRICVEKLLRKIYLNLVPNQKQKMEFRQCK
jgi:hypothetical protein